MIESDVVVVGSGAAALSAALTAAVEGAAVTVLERSSLLGGTSAVSGGGMWLPGNRLDPNFKDSLPGAKTYLQRLTLGLIPDPVLDRYLAEAGDIPEFFAKHTPLDFTAEVGRPDYHAPWEGSSLTNRTVFPGLYEMQRLGDLASRVRKPGPGGIPPVQRSEEIELDAEDLQKLIQSRLERGVAVRGRALVGGLIEGCLSAGVKFAWGARARALLVEDGRVSGVRVQGDGEWMEYRAGAGVILASGGFEWNRELWDSLVGLPWEGPGSPPDNEGDGLIMAAKIGAKLGNLDKAIWRPARYLGEKYDERPYMRMAMYYGAAPGEIIVNRAGRRFTNEGLNYNDICRVMTAFDPNTYEFPNDPCFVVGDNRVRSRAAGFDAEAGDGVDDRDQWHEAGTLKELAGKLGIDPSGLEAQIEEFNRYATEGTDPVFHRGSKPWDTHFHMVGASGRAIAPIVAPPFVGYRVRAGVFGTRGGPVTDENAQILDVDDRPISGLYGAGNVVASPFASAYPGGGATLGPAVTFGHVAGKALVESAAAATYGR